MRSINEYLLILLLLLIAQAEQSPKLVFIQEIFRHGARYPQTTLYPHLNDLFAKQQMSLGELTSQGRSMMYLLGKKMYDTYWKKLFAGTPYEFTYNQSRFYVRSTNVNRTIQSAESHLYGILQSLPPLKISKEQAKFSNPPYPGIQAKEGFVFGEKSKFFRPIAIHIDEQTMTPSDNGDFLANYMVSNCPNQANWIKQNHQKPAAIQIFKYPAFTKALRQLEASLNLPKNTIHMGNFYKYYDNLVCMKFLGKEVPQFLTRQSQTKRALEALLSINAYITYHSNQKQLRTTATDFFQATLNNIKNSIKSQSSPQWIIYSAHDITLGTIQAAMNLWNVDCIFDNYQRNITDPYDCVTTFPQFGAIMVLEVYQYSNRTITFKVNYNGKYLQIPFCDQNKECLVSIFEKWYDSWKVDDVKKACGVFPKYKKQIVSTVAGSVFAILLIIILYLVIPSEKKKTIIRRLFAKRIKTNID